MNTRLTQPTPASPSAMARRRNGSVLVIVLWIAFGLVAVALYYASSMSSELRVSDNRVSGVMAEQAIEGAARYVSFVLTNLATNGAMPDVKNYYCEAVPVGGNANDESCAHFWLIGRDNNEVNQLRQDEPVFGLIDEASKLNLNTVEATNLALLPNMIAEFADAIADWRDPDDVVTNTGAESTEYAMYHPPYQCKNTNFTTLEELRLVYGSTMDMLVGEDLNRNGVLDANEVDVTHNGEVDLGLYEYATVYSREPNYTRTNISDSDGLQTLFEEFFGSTRAQEIVDNISSSSGGGGGGDTTSSTTNTSLLQFYLINCVSNSYMTRQEFEQVAIYLTTTNATYITGRVNVNTASAQVLACLPGMTLDLAQEMVNYRRANEYNLNSIAWVVDALGQNNMDVISQLAQADCLTTQTYQFTADIAAVGPYGRGYRRVKFVFDLSNGTPIIVYRQDLTHLGWALGRDVRETWVTARKN
jgi:type II secretory pathway component PulK